MSHQDNQRLHLKAAAVARQAPAAWSELLAELKIYTDQARDRCVLSPIDQLQNAQGYAQACVKLLDVLQNCTTIADRIEEKRK